MVQDYISDITTAMNSEILGVVGSGFKELQFVIEVERNSFRGNHDRYGVLHGSAFQTPGVTKRATFSQSFQIILTKGYYDSSVSDETARSASQELYGLMLLIHKQLINTKAGAPAIVLHVQDTINILDPEYITEEKVAVLRANVELLYRYEL